MQESKNNRPLSDSEWMVSSSWSDRFLHSAAMQWVVSHTLFVITLLCIGCAVTLFLGVLLHKINTRQETELFQSSYWASQLTDPEKLFSKEAKEVSGEESQEKRTHALQQLISLVNSYPVLQHKYDGLIVQELWVKEKISEAAHYASRCVDYLKKNSLPLHAEYSAISCAIMENKLPEALERSLELDRRIVEAMQSVEQAPAERPSLQLQLIQAFNMLRIINLHAKLGQEEAFRQEMARLKSLMNTHNVLSQGQHNPQDIQYSLFADHLRKGKESLLDFLSSRKE